MEPFTRMVGIVTYEWRPYWTEREYWRAVERHLKILWLDDEMRRAAGVV